MLYLRTADGSFVRDTSITQLRRDEADAWIATRRDGSEVALARFFSTPGRVEERLPHLLPCPEAVLASRSADAPCCGLAECQAGVLVEIRQPPAHASRSVGGMAQQAERPIKSMRI